MHSGQIRTKIISLSNGIDTYFKNHGEYNPLKKYFNDDEIDKILINLIAVLARKSSHVTSIEIASSLANMTREIEKMNDNYQEGYKLHADWLQILKASIKNIKDIKDIDAYLKSILKKSTLINKEVLRRPWTLNVILQNKLNQLLGYAYDYVAHNNELLIPFFYENPQAKNIFRYTRQLIYDALEFTLSDRNLYFDMLAKLEQLEAIHRRIKSLPAEEQNKCAAFMRSHVVILKQSSANSILMLLTSPDNLIRSTDELSLEIDNLENDLSKLSIHSDDAHGFMTKLFELLRSDLEYLVDDLKKHDKNNPKAFKKITTKKARADQLDPIEILHVVMQYLKDYLNSDPARQDQNLDLDWQILQLIDSFFNLSYALSRTDSEFENNAMLLSSLNEYFKEYSRNLQKFKNYLADSKNLSPPLYTWVLSRLESYVEKMTNSLDPKSTLPQAMQPEIFISVKPALSDQGSYLTLIFEPIVESSSSSTFVGAFEETINQQSYTSSILQLPEDYDRHEIIRKSVWKCKGEDFSPADHELLNKLFSTDSRYLLQLTQKFKCFEIMQALDNFNVCKLDLEELVKFLQAGDDEYEPLSDSLAAFIAPKLIKLFNQCTQEPQQISNEFTMPSQKYLTLAAAQFAAYLRHPLNKDIPPTIEPSSDPQLVKAWILVVDSWSLANGHPDYCATNHSHFDMTYPEQDKKKILDFVQLQCPIPPDIILSYKAVEAHVHRNPSLK